MSRVMRLKKYVTPATEEVGRVVMEWLHCVGAISPGKTVMVQSEPMILTPEIDI